MLFPLLVGLGNGVTSIRSIPLALSPTTTPLPIGRTEYDLKDQMIRNTILETEKDVQEIKEQQKEMREDVKNIERMMMQK